MTRWSSSCCRALLAAPAAVLAVRLATGAPVLALRAGALVQGERLDVRMESVLVVVLAAVAFEAWFLFFAGSPLG